MRIGSGIVVVAVALLGLSCSPEEEPPITTEIATKVFCYDLLQAAGPSGGAFSHINLYEPEIDAGTFRDDADLFRAAGDTETAERIDDLADRLEAPAEDLQLTIYLTAAATQADVEEVRAAIESWAGVTSIDYVSSEEAFEEFSREFGDEPEVLSGLPEDALPASFRVAFSSAGELDAAQAAAQELEPVQDARPAQSPAAAVVTEMAAEFQELCRFGS